MSDHSINDPKRWLDRAKEARALAEQIDDPEAKRTMLKNADDYERSPKEPKNEQQDAGHSQSKLFDPGDCARVSAMGYTNKRDASGHAQAAPPSSVPNSSKGNGGLRLADKCLDHQHEEMFPCLLAVNCQLLANPWR
jgi:hypothetical protein